MSRDSLSVMGRPKKSEPSEQIRVPRSIARKLRRLAVEAEMDVGDYLAQEFGEAIDRRHRKWVGELASQERRDGDKAE